MIRSLPSSRRYRWSFNLFIGAYFVLLFAPLVVTMILGFSDDVSIRVTGDDGASRVDIRSASRYGRHDLGRNVERVRALMREIVGRLESTIPGAAENRRKRTRPDKDGKEPIARKGADRKKADPRR